MKVLINQSTGYLFADIANTLSNHDEVVLMCADKANLKVESRVKLDHIIAYDKSSTIKRLWTWTIATLQIWWKVITKYRKAELLIVSNPPFANLLALVLPNKELSHLVYDIYPEVLVSGHVVSDNNFITKLWRKANRKVYSRAKHVYTIGDGMAECLSQYIPKEKIDIVNCWPNANAIHRIEKQNNLFIKENALDGKFVVLYSGNLGNTHRMEVLVDVAEKLKYEKDIVFVICGEGGKKKIIQQKIKENKVENVRLLPYVPADLLSHSLSSADIAVVTLDVTASNLSVPSKTFNLMQVGAALMVLGSQGSELGNMLDNYEMGRLFNPDDIEGISAFVLDMKNNPEKLKAYQINSSAAISDFSIKNAGRFLNG